MRILKIVSGGQTGVDRAAFDAAISQGIGHGGWVPRGRKAEDGEISSAYHVVETPSDEYMERTLLNVRDSDVTLIVAKTPLSGGTAYTESVAKRLVKPCHVISPDDCDDEQALSALKHWIESIDGTILNLAGPREADTPGIYAIAHNLVTRLLECCQSQGMVPASVSIAKAWEYHKDADSQLHSRLGLYMTAQAFLIGSLWAFLQTTSSSGFAQDHKLGILRATAILGILFSGIVFQMCSRLIDGIELLKKKYLEHDEVYQYYIDAARRMKRNPDGSYSDTGTGYKGPRLLALAPMVYWIYILFVSSS